jgi:hypothetical protein
MTKTIDLRRLQNYFAPGDIEWKPLRYTKDRKRAMAAPYITNRDSAVNGSPSGTVRPTPRSRLSRGVSAAACAAPRCNGELEGTSTDCRRGGRP